MSWQPIESAPKDGTRVLLVVTMRDFSGISHIHVGSWSRNNGEWRWPVMYQPTHWMPLPAPPTLSSEQNV